MVSGPYYGFGARYRSYMWFKSSLWNLVRNGLEMIWIGPYLRKLGKFEVLKKFHDFDAKFIVVNVIFVIWMHERVRMMFFRFVCIFGLEPRGLEWVLDRAQSILRFKELAVVLQVCRLHNCEVWFANASITIAIRGQGGGPSHLPSLMSKLRLQQAPHLRIIVRICKVSSSGQASHLRCFGSIC